MQSFGLRRRQHPDGNIVRPIDLAVNCTTRVSERQVSEWTGRPPGKTWPAALGNRRRSSAEFERLLTV